MDINYRKPKADNRSLCDTCFHECKKQLDECSNYDRDCFNCICENRALYDCGDCDFEPVDDDEF